MTCFGGITQISKKYKEKNNIAHSSIKCARNFHNQVCDSHKFGFQTLPRKTADFQKKKFFRAILQIFGMKKWRREKQNLGNYKKTDKLKLKLQVGSVFQSAESHVDVHYKYSIFRVFFQCTLGR